MADTGASDRLISSLSRLKVSASDIEAVSAAWRDYTKVQDLAADSGEWTKAQIGDVKAWENRTVNALKAVVSERNNESKALRAQAVATEELRDAQVKAIKVQQEEHQTLRRRAAKEILGGGPGGMIAGGLALGASKEALEQGAELQAARVKMAAAGIPGSEIDAALAESAQLATKYANVKISDMMESYKELRSVLLSPDETPGLLPTVVAARSALNAVDRSGEMGKGIQFAAKGAEMFGIAQDHRILGRDFRGGHSSERAAADGRGP
jgi:hypothetical protein